MKDKFSKLILLIQANLRKKREEWENYSNKRDSVIAQIQKVESDIEKEKGILSNLKEDLKKYKWYYFKIIGSIVYMILTVLSGIACCSFLGFFSYLAILNFLDSAMILLCIGLITAVTGFVFSIIKSFYNSNKDNIRIVKESKKVRKKYKSKEKIKKRIKRTEEKIRKLMGDLENLQSTEKELRVSLESVSADIDALKRKLELAKDTFVASTFKVEGYNIERKLDLEYEKSHIEEELGSIDESLGKPFVMNKK